MNRVWGKAFGIAGLILMLGGAPSWGAPPNNDPSDAVGNTAGGTGALQNTTGGVFNTADGFGALQNNTSGSVNTASGFEALFSSTTGSNNTAVGGFALFNNTLGLNNTASGVDALFSNTTGLNNTAVGGFALFSSTTGVNNIAVGLGAGVLLTSGNNNIYLGNSGGTATESNTMRLGGVGVQSQTFIAGIAGVPVTGSAVLISSTGQLGIQASSARYKHDIQPMGTRSQGLFQLRPVTFRYKQDSEGERQYGLIAEDVAKVYPELVTRGATGEIESVRYYEVIPMLLNEVQHQHRQLATQARQLTTQAQELAALKAQNARLRVQAQELATLKAQNARLRAVVSQQQERDAALAARLERLEAAVARAATLASR
jgi:Chaperone of endosialidase